MVLFREWKGGSGGGREKRTPMWERHMDCMSPNWPGGREQTQTKVRALELNPKSFSAQADAPTTEQHRPGQALFKAWDPFNKMALFPVFFQLPAERPALKVFLCISLLELFLKYLFPPFLCHHMNPHFPVGTTLIVTIGFPQTQENFPFS